MLNLSLEQLHTISRAVWNSSGEGYNGEYSHHTEKEIDDNIGRIILDELANMKERNRKNG